MKEPLLRKGTYGCYEMYYKKYITPKLGRIKIKDLMHQHIQEYLSLMRTAEQPIQNMYHDTRRPIWRSVERLI